MAQWLRAAMRLLRVSSAKCRYRQTKDSAAPILNGFAVSTISELAQSCQIFGLREHPIFWSISEPGLQVRAMGPFSTHQGSEGPAV